MFAKLFQSMYDGSLATHGPWEALVTFQQFLVLADRFGDVDITAEVIARRTIIPLPIIEKGISELCKPDPHSRDKREEGRRLVPINPERSWGWHIVNYSKYAAIRSAEERREYKASYYREKVVPKLKAGETGLVIERIPMIGGEEFEVKESFVKEMSAIYLNVDVPLTLKEIRGWCLGNPTRLKTPRGIRKFIVSWLQREQDKHGRA
jgi:hypothetical protein